MRMHTRWKSLPIWIWSLSLAVAGVAGAADDVNAPVPLRDESEAPVVVETPVPERVRLAEPKGFYEKYLSGRLELGTRITKYSLKETKRGEKNRGSFIGSINELHEDQDYAPTKVYGQYKATKYLGVGISYDHVRAITKDGPLENNTDGNVDAAGPIVYALACYPNKTILTPFAELGCVFYSADFEEDPGWSENGLRQMKVDDTTGLVLGLGCDVTVYRRFSINAYFRYVEAGEIDAKFYRAGDLLLTGSFPISHYAYGLGAKFTF